MTKIETDFNFVSRAINSCKTPEQLSSAKNLIDNFNRLYDEPTLYEMLLDEMIDMYFKILYIKIL